MRAQDRPPSRYLAVLALAVVLAVLRPPPAAAAEVTEVVEEVEAEGLYVERGGEQIDVATLRATLDRTTARVLPVLLADEPPGGGRAFAEDVLDDLTENGTVLVISPSEIQVVSGEVTTGQVDQALDRADDDVDFDRADAGEIAAAFAVAFDDVIAAGGEQTADEEERLPVAALLAGVLAIAGVLAFVAWRTRERAQRRRAERLLREAGDEVRGQIAVMAERILGLADRVELAGNAEASGLFTDATAAYREAQTELERSTSPQELERVSDELDHARWQMEAVAALLDGREPPPRPEREPACFFDPTHGAGIETGELETAAGTREVRVCASCAGKLEAGEAPEPRMIAVGGQQMPAPMAPRPYGGGGFGWLDDFAMVRNGHRQPYGWGGYRPARRWPVGSGGISMGGRRGGGGFRVTGSGGRSRGARGRGGRRR